MKFPANGYSCKFPVAVVEVCFYFSVLHIRGDLGSRRIAACIYDRYSKRKIHSFFVFGGHFIIMTTGTNIPQNNAHHIHPIFNGEAQWPNGHVRCSVMIFA